METSEEQQKGAFVQLSDQVSPDLLEQRGMASRQEAGISGRPPAAAGSQTQRADVRSFPSAEEAATAFADAVRQGNDRALQEIFGPRAKAALFSGDVNADRQLIAQFLAAYDTRHTLAPIKPGQMALRVGATDWPLPFPIVQTATGWQFDIDAGLQQLLDRRIGRNEFTAMRVLLACVDAQQDYFQRMKAIDGKGFFASRILSSRGRHNGLYWWVEPGQLESPLAPLIREAQGNGYPGASYVNGTPIPYQGYFFRILQEQGKDAPGGAKKYMRDAQMTDGFALVAWPAFYGFTGIMTFLIGSDGTLFQRDFGPQTTAIASALKQFNPGQGWKKIVITAPQ